MTMHKPDDRLIISTRDLGLAISNHLADSEVFAIHWDGERSGGSATVDFVDCSDANNPTVHMLNGQKFIVRIIAA